MTGKEHTNHAGARKGARAHSQPKPAAARPKPPAARTNPREELELPEGLHRRLTREALGDDGSVESFAMLLLAVELAIKAGDTVTAQNLLFRSVWHAYENSGHHVDAGMGFRDRMKLKLGALREPGAEA